MSNLHAIGVYLSVFFIFSSMAKGLSIPTSANSTDCFLYFAYGSNLLKERLHKDNPSATFISVGIIQNYTLQFGWSEHFSGDNSWHGGVASIQKSNDGEVWGVVWQMGLDDLQSLDDQEGVFEGLYRPLQLEVTTPNGSMICRSYQMVDLYPKVPSPAYKQVVCLGARQSGLPLDYIKNLEALQTNGYSGPSTLDTLEGIEAFHLPNQ